MPAAFRAVVTNDRRRPGVRNGIGQWVARAGWSSVDGFRGWSVGLWAVFLAMRSIFDCLCWSSGEVTTMTEGPDEQHEGGEHEATEHDPKS